MIVLVDILPEATDDYPYGFLMCVLGDLLIYWVDRYGTNIGSYAAVSGMGIHNLCEGIILMHWVPKFLRLWQQLCSYTSSPKV